jgi:branched-subunit amino acid transport protein
MSKDLNRVFEKDKELKFDYYLAGILTVAIIIGTSALIAYMIFLQYGD